MDGKDKKRIAPESAKTKRARKKLCEQWAKKERLVTKAALAETVDKIHQWIAAHAMNRVHFKKKSICLFDQNQNAAELSLKVQQFAQQLMR